MRYLERRRARDDGFTLVELLVAMSVVMVLVAVSMSAVIVSSQAVSTSREVHDLNEEARHAVNRMARDLRQAEKVVTAVNPDGPTFDPTKIVAVRFQADYDGDTCIGGVNVFGPAPAGGCLTYNASNPEDITYCYEPATRQLYVVDNQASGVVPVSPGSTSCAGGQPLLAGNVGAFKVEYRSSAYRYDTSPSDGVTTWRELDAAGSPAGDMNGLLDAELPLVNSVVINTTMLLDGHKQVYRTQVDLRNGSK
jgi:type II secretory pathway pseudopilin PulG